MTKLVTAHDLEWENMFAQEAAALGDILGTFPRVIHHIGSTSIPDILAKPIIDILIEVESFEDIDALAPAFQKLGYQVMGEFGIEGRRYFRKDTDGIRTHHVHVFEIRSYGARRHLAFRDYLLAHPEAARAYSDLKASLVVKDDADMDSYIDGKDAFVKDMEARALEWCDR